MFSVAKILRITSGFGRDNSLGSVHMKSTSALSCLREVSRSWCPQIVLTVLRLPHSVIFDVLNLPQKRSVREYKQERKRIIDSSRIEMSSNSRGVDGLFPAFFESNQC
jgi:uncharacterized protein YceK